MVQSSKHAGLVFEALQSFGITSQTLGQDLYRNIPA
jgi:hypothetical protein